MANINPHLCIPANPDISGIGVRAAIYAQNMLSFGPVIWALSDGKVSVGELDSIETQSMTILLTAFSILVSAIIQVRTGGLSNFHISLILDLSWMNNTSTFIYYLLYIRYKTQTERDDDEVPMELKWSVWIHHVWRALAPIRIINTRQPEEGATKSGRALAAHRSLFRRMFTKFVLIIGSIHLTFMAAVGIWFWRHPTTFSISRSCTPPSTVLFGDIPITSQALRRWSLVIYSIFLVPPYNLVLPTCGLLALQIYWPRLPHWLQFKSEKHRHNMPVYVGLGILGAINVFFIINIETTIKRNAPLRDPGDDEWTFGQTLALILLLVPLRDLVETILDRREARARIERRRRMEENEELVADLLSNNEAGSCSTASPLVRRNEIVVE